MNKSTSSTDDTEADLKNLGSIPILLALGISVLFAVALTRSGELGLKVTQKDILYCVVLFLLPIILTLLSFWLVRTDKDEDGRKKLFNSRLNAGNMGGILSSTFCWVVYTYWGYQQDLSYMAIFLPVTFVFSLILFSGYIVHQVFLKSDQDDKEVFLKNDPDDKGKGKGKGKNHSQPPTGMECVVDTMNRRPFSSLLQVFSLFISVTYLFGFAVAYNDTYLSAQNKYGVHLTSKGIPQKNIEINEPDKAGHKKVQAVFKEIINSNSKTEREIKSINELVNSFNKENQKENILLVNRLAKHLRAKKDELGNSDTQDRLTSTITNILFPNPKVKDQKDLTIHRLSAFFKSGGRSDLDGDEKGIIDTIVNLYYHNLDAYKIEFLFDHNKADFTIDSEENDKFDNIKDKILNIKVDNERFSITILGYSSPPGSEEKNEDLSKFRGDFVKDQLQKKLVSLNLPNIEIIQVSFGEEGDNSLGDNSLESNKNDTDNISEANQRKVRVVVQRIPAWEEYSRSISDKERTRPTLLEYMYFSIYTITTTGYGDIIPVSHEAKLIVAIENLVEVFFGVIFFGVFLFVINDRKRKRKSEPKKALTEAEALALTLAEALALTKTLTQSVQVLATATKPPKPSSKKDK